MRIGIVNDVALAREALRRAVLSVPGYRIAWQAADGEEAVRRTLEDTPDVVLMDLVMPGMDGAEATREIMARCPCPVVLVTASVSNNIQLVLRGLSAGGLDVVNTPVLTPDGQVWECQPLLTRLARLASSRQGSNSFPLSDVVREGSGTGPIEEVPAMLALGASTGGPDALAVVLSALPVTFPGVVVVIEHIGVEFAGNLAGWLQGHCRLPVEIARQGVRPHEGVVYVAASDDHLVVRADQRFAYTPDPKECPYRPSVDAFYLSLEANWPQPGVAVLLTGMGSDGARGMLALRLAGWLTIAQDRSSSIVYGMPGAAAEMGAASRILSLAQIPAAVLARFSSSAGRGQTSPRPASS